MSTHYISPKDISFHELFDGRLAVTRTQNGMIMTDDIVARIEVMIEELAEKNSDEANSLRRIKTLLDAGYTVDHIHKNVAYLTKSQERR